jgi:hypothetical protein
MLSKYWTITSKPQAEAHSGIFELKAESSYPQGPSDINKSSGIPEASLILNPISNKFPVSNCKFVM